MNIKITLATTGTVLLLTSALYAQDGAALFDAKCAVCHKTSRPSDISNVTAPAIMGVMRHVKMRYPKKEEAVKFVVEYALNPQASKAVCMPEKMKRFGLMPSQQGNVSKEELQTIAEWIYDNFPPKGFRGMSKGKRKGYAKDFQEGE